MLSFSCGESFIFDATVLVVCKFNLSYASADNLRNKLYHVWKLYDNNEKGFLSTAELSMLFECLFCLAIDAASTALAHIEEVISTSADLYTTHHAATLIYIRLRKHVDFLQSAWRSFSGNVQAVQIVRYWSAQHCAVMHSMLCSILCL